MNWISLVAFVCGMNYNSQFPGYIEAASKEFNVDKTIILSVIHTESRCNPTVVGASNDTGLMQIVPYWHQDRIEKLHVNDLFDPKQNIRVGSSLLSSLQVETNTIDALVIYNGGYARPKQSYKYAKDVIAKAHTYKTLLNES